MATALAASLVSLTNFTSMKKLLTMAVLGLSTLSLAAAGTDVLSTANFLTQNPGLNTTATDDSGPINEDFSYEGESGAFYYFNQCVTGANFWALSWANYPADPGYMTSMVSDKYISEIKVTLPEGQEWQPNEFSFYVSDQVMPDKKTAQSATYISLPNNNGVYTWKADGLYKYLWLNTSQRSIGSIEITYVDEAPKIQVKTPTIQCWNPIPGGNVSISTATPDATLHITWMNMNTGDEETTVVEGSNANVPMPGSPDDDIVFLVTAKKEGFTDSEEAQEMFTVIKPDCPRPQFNPAWGDVVIGQKIEVTCEVEGATAEYTISRNNWDDTANNWQEGPFTATFPFSVTVPERMDEGSQFVVSVTAKAEGYKDSSNDLYVYVISKELPVPTFSIADGTEVKKGTELSIYRSDNSTTIHYVINDGEEITSEEYMAKIVIDEPITVKAWVSGKAPFEPSAVVEASYTIETFNEYTDAIEPLTLTDETANFNGNYMFNLEYTSPVTQATYKYDGQIYCNTWYGNVNVFYFQKNNIFYNTSAPSNIYRIKIDESPEYGRSCYLMLSETPITEVTGDMTEFDYNGARLRVGDNQQDYGWNEWIDLHAIGEIKGVPVNALKYFAIYRFGQTVQVPRVIVEYNDAGTQGVDGITFDAAGADVEIFNLNGVRVNSENLVPGIYIRKAAGKSEKFVVR